MLFFAEFELLMCEMFRKQNKTKQKKRGLGRGGGGQNCQPHCLNL